MHPALRSDVIILLSWIVAGLAAWGAAAAVVAVLVGRMIACRDRQDPRRRESERLFSPIARSDRSDETPVADRRG